MNSNSSIVDRYRNGRVSRHDDFKSHGDKSINPADNNPSPILTRSKSSTSVSVTGSTRRKKSNVSSSIVDQVLAKKDNQDVPGFTKNISISRKKSITNVNDIDIHNHADDIPDLISFETPFEKISTPSIAAKKISLPSRFTHRALKFRKKCAFASNRLKSLLK